MNIQSTVLMMSTLPRQGCARLRGPKAICAICALALCLMALPGWGQAPDATPADAAQQDAAQQDVTPGPAAADQDAAQAAPATTPAQDAQTAQPTINQDSAGPGLVLNLDGASLRQLIDLLAQRLQINYILDPRVDGEVIIRTYGEIRAVEIRSVLETVLRINGASMVKVGDLYRIVPAADAVQLPISPMVNATGQQLPQGEQLILNLLFLKFATAKEVEGIVTPFLGQGARISSFEPANLLLILDNARNMRRTMELVSLFDSETLASQRVRLYEVKNGRPSDLASELEKIFKGIAFSKESNSLTFLPIDRINTILAVAPNPGVFDEVRKWIEKLDVKVTLAAGSVNNYVYRVKYGDAFFLSQAITQLYTGMAFGFPGMGMGMGGMGMGGMGMGGMGMGGMGMGGMGMGGMGMGGMGMGGMGMGGGLSNRGFRPGGAMPGGAQGGGVGAMGGAMGGAGMAGGMGGMGGMGTMGMGGMGMGTVGMGGMGMGGVGNFLGMGGFGMLSPTGERIPHVIPNAFDNSLLIQATPQEYDQIVNLLEQIDIPPRQVLIEAKIYEVTLTGAFAMGVQAFMNRLGDDPLNPGNGEGGDAGVARRALSAATSGAGITMTGGMLAGRSRQLLAVLTAAEDNRLTKSVAAPAIIATDSIPAVITVGNEVPILTAQAASSVLDGGTSQFAQTITNRQAGITLNITARVTPSGIVTMLINQDFSTPLSPSATGIQSPSFNNRTVSTQVTVEDGDTVAIGGIIDERELESTAGVPFLHRIPVLGAAFGQKSRSTSRTELVVFLTPRVIYDTNQMIDATEELKSRMDRVLRLIRNSSDRF
jgi:general secretion pathway protein D